MKKLVSLISPSLPLFLLFLVSPAAQFSPSSFPALLLPLVGQFSSLSPQKTNSTRASEYSSEDLVSQISSAELPSHKRDGAGMHGKEWWRKAAHPLQQQDLALRSGQLQCETLLEWKLAGG